MGAMGLLGNVMVGVGGKVMDYAMQEGRLLREERMRELDRNWRSEEAAKDRTFKIEEANTDRAFRSGESKKDREFRGSESEAERELRLQLQGSSQAHSASEADKARSFQAEEADKTRSHGLLTNVKPDESGRMFRLKKDGEGVSVEYLEGVKGTDNRKKAAEAAASEVASSVIGKDSGLGNEDRYAKYTAVYNAEMEKRGYPQPKDTAPPTPSSRAGNKVIVRTRAEYDALPSGSKYVAPDGSERTKP